MKYLDTCNWKKSELIHESVSALEVTLLLHREFLMVLDVILIAHEW